MAISNPTNTGPMVPPGTGQPPVNPHRPPGMDPAMWAQLYPQLLAQGGGASAPPVGAGSATGIPTYGGSAPTSPVGAGSATGIPTYGGGSSSAPATPTPPAPTVPPPPPGAPGAPGLGVGGLAGLMTGNVQASFGPQKTGFDAIRGALGAVPDAGQWGSGPGVQAVQNRINGAIGRANQGISGLAGLMGGNQTLPAPISPVNLGGGGGASGGGLSNLMGQLPAGQPRPAYTGGPLGTAVAGGSATGGGSGSATAPGGAQTLPNPIWQQFKADNGGGDPAYWGQYKSAVSGGDPAKWKSFKQNVIAGNGTPTPGAFNLPAPRAEQR